MQSLSEKIFESYRKNGKRVTNQRKTLISIIVKYPEKSSKEIFYLAHEKDKSINLATVYRTLKSLEELGYITRKNIISI